MKAGGGRLKGSSYERIVAKRLEKWWGSEIRRTPLSGGWSNSAEFGTKGDLICKGGWPFVFELKKHEGWNLEQLLVNDKCPIKDWWKQAVDEAGKKIPVLVFSRNHQPDYLMMRKADWSKLSPNWEAQGVMDFFMEITMDSVLIGTLDHLLQVNPPKPSPNRNKIHLAKLKKKLVEEELK